MFDIVVSCGPSAKRGVVRYVSMTMWWHHVAPFAWRGETEKGQLVSVYTSDLAAELADQCAD